MLTVAIVASLAGGGTAAAHYGQTTTSPDVATEIAAETVINPVMDLPNGCAGDDWSSEEAID
jgi:hypothetical protein